MMTPLRRLAGRVTRSAAPGVPDDAFVSDVRTRIEPHLTGTGFVLAAVEASDLHGVPATVVRYEADPRAFVARYPGTAPHLRDEGSPLDLWFALDARQGTVQAELEGWQLSALLAVVRSGPGAPPRRRQLDDPTVTSLPAEQALERAEDLLRRLLDAAARP